MILYNLNVCNTILINGCFSLTPSITRIPFTVKLERFICGSKKKLLHCFFLNLKYTHKYTFFTDAIPTISYVVQSKFHWIPNQTKFNSTPNSEQIAIDKYLYIRHNCQRTRPFNYRRLTGSQYEGTIAQL